MKALPIRQLIEEATPGPWNIEGHFPNDLSIVNRAHTGDDWDIATVHSSEANAALIARCSPSTMLAVVEALEAGLYLHGQHQIRFKEPAFEGEWHKLNTALSLLNATAPAPQPEKE